MRYLPNSPTEREQMLAEIGAASIDSLFEVIPAEYRLTRDLDVPREGLPAQEFLQLLGVAQHADRDGRPVRASFRGALGLNDLRHGPAGQEAS